MNEGDEITVSGSYSKYENYNLVIDNCSVSKTTKKTLSTSP